MHGVYVYVLGGCSPHTNKQFSKTMWVSYIQFHLIVTHYQPRDNDAESSPSLYTCAEANLGDRVLGEEKMGSFIALPGKGGHSGLIPSKPRVPTWGRQ